MNQYIILFIKSLPSYAVDITQRIILSYTTAMMSQWIIIITHYCWNGVKNFCALKSKETLCEKMVLQNVIKSISHRLCDRVWYLFNLLYETTQLAGKKSYPTTNHWDLISMFPHLGYVLWAFFLNNCDLTEWYCFPVTLLIPALRTQ